jgi:hypothetical protein
MIQRLLPALTAFLLALSPASALALDRLDADQRDTDRQGWIVPDFMKLQTAGYAGLIAVGLGYAGHNDVLNLSVAYGFTPKMAAGADIHTIGVTMSLRPFEIDLWHQARWIPVYAGGGLLFVLGDQYFLTAPEWYRDPLYYPPTAAHWTLHAGTEVDMLPDEGGVFERHGLYAELVTLDTYFLSALESSEEVQLVEALSLALGYRASW